MVLNDINGNTIHDADEGGVAGATLWADLNGDGQCNNREPHTQTNAAGGYVLKNVPAGFNRLIACRLPTGFTFTTPGGNTATRDVLVSQASPAATAVFCAANDTRLSGNVTRMIRHNPYNQPVPHATVWADLDKNGQIDAGEPHAATSSAGRYTLIGDIPAGTPIRAQSDYTLSTPASGAYVFAEPNERLNHVNFVVY